MTKDQCASIKHALLHLKANKIADKGGAGWYSGSSRAQFVKRHKKTIALLESMLESGRPLAEEEGERAVRRLGEELT